MSLKSALHESTRTIFVENFSASILTESTWTYLSKYDICIAKRYHPAVGSFFFFTCMSVCACMNEFRIQSLLHFCHHKFWLLIWNTIWLDYVSHVCTFFSYGISFASCILYIRFFWCVKGNLCLLFMHMKCYSWWLNICLKLSRQLISHIFVHV